MYDVIVLGGGVCGTAIARLLSRYTLKLALLEAQEDVAMGATKANSAIVHGGYAEAHDTRKGRLCYQGRKQFAALDKELHFGFAATGSMVLAFEEAQLGGLEALLANGKKNGLDDLSILHKDQILQKEPNLNPAVKYALYCRGAGVCSPYELAIAFAENALQNGLDLFLNSRVTHIAGRQGGGFLLTTQDGRAYASKFVINATGISSAEVSGLAGVGGFSVHPRSGEYFVLNKGSGALINSVLFQMPTKMGKGILVAPTVYGNLLVGPDAIDEAVDDRSTHVERLYAIYQQALHTTPGLDIRKFLRSFAGVRPVSSTDDFVIEHTTTKGFINVAGIQSPGVTSSPAIAEMVRDILGDVGLQFVEKPEYTPNRKATYAPHADIPPTELNARLQLPEGAQGRMICRCEQVEETAVRDAAQRGIPITTVDAIKRRTRAGMGWCQGEFCCPRTAAVLSGLSDTEISAQTDVERASLTRVGREEMLAYCKEKMDE